MTAPYLLVADIHAHNWSAFATTDASGINSRLLIQLNELERAADELRTRGGRRMIVAGDTFHVRGSIDPEVFNPVQATIKRIVEKGIAVIFIPGNHDLKGKETTELGNAIQTLDDLRGAGTVSRVVTKPMLTTVPTTDSPGQILIPWCSNRKLLEEAIATPGLLEHERVSEGKPANYDLIIHAGIDGVLPGVPNAGLSATDVAAWGFNRVFAGHYHNHVVMEGGKVVSIGATTHQTWSDIGTKAGFLFVYPDHIEWQASHAPEFVELSGETDPDEIPLIVDANYVRIRGMKLSDAEIKKFRADLEEMGARGVTFQVAREAVAGRIGAAVGKAATLDESVAAYIGTMSIENEATATGVRAQCADVLNHVRSIA